MDGKQPASHQQAPPLTIEQRLAKLEADVAEIKHQLAPGVTTAEQLARMPGVLSHLSKEEMAEFERSWREVKYADRPEDLGPLPPPIVGD